MKTRITKYNFNNLLPNAPFRFETISAKAGSKNKTMKHGNNYSTVKYLHINDIIHVLEKGIKEHSGPNKKHMIKWKFFLDNDIQGYLDNEHERIQNEI